MLPVEFFVQGTPISHQSKNKGLLEDWREKVAAAARVQIDEDNLLKPIQDALRELICAADDQVVDGTCRKRDINGEFRVRYMSPVLAQAFVAGDEFVHQPVAVAMAMPLGGVGVGVAAHAVERARSARI